MTKKGFYYLFIVSLIIIGIESCGTRYFFRHNYTETNKLLYANLRTKLFLKAHHKNGNISILRDTWQVDTTQHLLTGSGEQYDFNRNKIKEGTFKIPLDSIALYETNRKLMDTENGRITSLALLAGVDVVLGIFCIANPKACFGSCPTFYLNENDNFHYADAEGFSNAILPSFEYGDIDALSSPLLKNGKFSLTMKNEALETHCVNEVKLLAFPKNENEFIYHSPANEFYLCTNTYLPKQVLAPEGDITQLLAAEDRCERFSLADENNLSSKEEIILDFDTVQSSHKLGLLLDFRQTLMTTYFIYSAMGYMGNEVGDIFSKLETDQNLRSKLKGSIQKELGNIDVYLWNESNSTWEWQHALNETGPIAINRQIISLNKINPTSATRIKIKLNKGLWRIDFAALTEIKKKVEPAVVYPQSILYKGKTDHQALNRIIDPSRYLISMPGDEFKFNFEMPDSTLQYQFFLYSKGYYLEWMRAHWIKDKNLLKLKQLLDSPKDFLKSEAESYKQYEAVMEEQFWNSKVDTKTFSYHGQ